MAFAAATSLYHTIDLLLMSSRTSIAYSAETVLKIARWGAKRLQDNLQKYDETKSCSEGVLAVEARIRDEARRLEDLIASEAAAQFLYQLQNHGTFSPEAAAQFLSQSQSHGRFSPEAAAQFLSRSQSHGRFFLNLNHLKQDVDCFLGEVEKMREEYSNELYKAAAAAAAAVAVSSSTSQSAGGNGDSNDDDVIGLSGELRYLRDFIIAQADGGRLSKHAITGMAGIGKTTLTKKLFHDSMVRDKFECRAFVRVGQKYDFQDIFRDIVAQLLNVDSGKILMQGNENDFMKSLRGRKYLIVLDDVWDSVFERELGTKLKNHGVDTTGQIMLTSRIQLPILRYRIRFLNEEESWELLQRKVFGELHDCPHELVKAGKKIAENCEGLPLLIISVAQLLLKSPKTLDFWNKVAKMQDPLFEDAMDQIYEVLLPSFHYLNQNSKACFLYMCVFPKDYVVRRSKIDNLWLAEGFADGVRYVLSDIADNNLVVVRQENWNNTVKDCNLHVVNRHLCKRESENNKFIFILKSYVADGSTEGIEERPHLAIYHNTLLAIEEVRNSIRTLSTLRSVLCTGPYHQYQVPINFFEGRLLRVLDALTIRFYEFPVEVVKLIQLRYLSLTTNANLPPSISKLWFLECLIVHQHLSIINRARAAESSCVPMEIWEMDQLKHLQIIGRNLPHPRPGKFLPNLTHLLDVGVHSCAQVVLESLPKLEKLRIQIESAPDAAQTMSSFDHIYGLKTLLSLGSVVVNPKLSPTHILQPRSYMSDSMPSLEKLSLNGFGYPWKDMSRIAKLPHLQVLKLQCYAFRGEKWDAEEMIFKSLKYLLIADTDLVEWTGADDKTFPSLSHLTMKNCYKLRKVEVVKSVKVIVELVDCNPLSEIWKMRSVAHKVRKTGSWK